MCCFYFLQNFVAFSEYMKFTSRRWFWYSLQRVQFKHIEYGWKEVSVNLSLIMSLWIFQRATAFWTLPNRLPNKFPVQEFDRRKCLWSSLPCLAIFLFCSFGTCILTDRYAQVQLKKFIKPQSIRKKCKTCYSSIT